MSNKENFLKLVSKEKTSTIENVKERIKNRAMLRESQQIAIKVLMKLDELGWAQKDLATKLEVSPQQVTKIVSGKENLTIETQIKLQTILDIPVLASYYENKKHATDEKIVVIEKHVESIEAQSSQFAYNYRASSTMTVVYKANTQEDYQRAI